MPIWSKIVAVLLLVSTPCFAATDLKQSGVHQGYFNVLDCGAGLTCTNSGITASMSSSGITSVTADSPLTGAGTSASHLQLPTTATPQFTRLGLGTAADSTKTLIFGSAADQNILLTDTDRFTAGKGLSMQAGNTGQPLAGTSFTTLSQGNRNWNGMGAARNGNIYAVVDAGDIYMRTAGSGNFNALSQTSRGWGHMTTTSNGDVYVTVYGGDIYKQTGGSGNFVGVSAGNRSWTGIVADASDNIYASVYNGDIYESVSGGAFTGLAQTTRQWSGMTVRSGDVYCVAYGGDIYKQTAGAGNFVAMSAGNKNWTGLTTDGSGNIWASVDGGDIYKQTGGSGAFVGHGETSRAWYDVFYDPATGNIYACTYGSDIYMMGVDSGTADLAGGSLVLAAGYGKGAGASDISLQAGTTLSSGVTLQTVSEKMIVRGNGRVGIGTSTPNTSLEVAKTSANTSTIQEMQRLTTNSTGTVATNFGNAVLSYLQDSTTAGQLASQIATIWTTATHGSASSAITFSGITSGGSLTEWGRISGSGLVMGSTYDITDPNIKSASGARYVCVDTNGKLISQAGVCVGT